MHMLFDSESLVLCFQIHTNCYVECFVFICKSLVIGILYISSCIFVPLLYIDIVFHKLLVKVFHYIVFSLQVNNRSVFTFLINKNNRRNACISSYDSIVCTKVGSNMNNTRTVFRRNVVAWNNTERSICKWLDAWQKLFILHLHKVCTLIVCNNTVRYYLVPLLIFIEVGILTFFVEVC